MKKHIEIAKTIALTALVAGVISFIAGAHYQTNVLKGVPTAHAEVKPSK